MPDTVVSADGTPLALWRSGEGPPLVLVHGAAADHSRWAPVLPALEAHFTGGLGLGESPRWHDERLWFSNRVVNEIAAVDL